MHKLCPFVEYSTDFVAGSKEKENIISLIPDHLASDALISRLSDTQLKHNFWPHPGVYRIREFATALLKERSRHFTDSLSEIPAKATTLEKFLIWCEASKKHQNFESLHKTFKNFKNLLRYQSFELSMEDWKEILLYLESKGKTQSSLELKEVSKNILSFLEYESALHKTGYLRSAWEELSLSLEYLKGLARGSMHETLLRASQLNPFQSGKTLKIFFPHLSSLYHFESQFLKQLRILSSESKSRIDLFEYCVADDSLDEQNAISQTIKTKLLHEALSVLQPIPEDKLFFDKTNIILLEKNPQDSFSRGEWIFAKAPSYGSEWIQYSDSTLTLKNLKILADYYRCEKAPWHIFLRDKNSIIECLRKIEDFPEDLFLCADLEEFQTKLFKFLTQNSNLQSLNLDKLLSFATEANDLSNLSFIDLLFEFSLFPSPQISDDLRNRRERLEQNHGHFYSSLCSAILDGGQCVIATPKSEIEDYFNGLAIDNLKADVFISRELDPLLEARGVEYPKHSVLLRNQFRLFITNTASWKILEILPRKFELQKSPTFHITSEQSKISVSALETFLQCPAKYFFQNKVRQQSADDWDSEKISPSAKGRWIHSVFEDLCKKVFPKHLSVNDLDLHILKHLEDGITKHFSDFSSPHYQELLKFSAKVISPRLAKVSWELNHALSASFERKTILSEQKWESSFASLTLRFVCDHVEIDKNGDFFILDYKTGVSDQSRIETAIKNGKIQNPLYRSLIQNLSASEKSKVGLHDQSKCLGFAYFNPLNPENSALYLPQDTAHSLQDFFKSKDANVHLYNETELDASIQEQMDLVSASLKTGIFSPLPRKDSLCSNCTFQDSCGRPQLRFDVDITQNESSSL